jgi:hypothetical protein
MERSLGPLAAIGATPGESEEARLRRVLLVSLALIITATP